MYTYLFYFLIYSFLGWLLEVCYAALNTKQFINRGFLNGPYCPIYGVGVMTIMYFVYPFKKNLIFLFILSIVLTSLIELITGFILEKAFHYRWWDYSNVPFNLGGYICLKFSIIWGLACVFVTEIIHPVVNDIINWTPRTIGEIVITIFLILITVDFIVTVKTVLKLNARMKRLQLIADDIHKFSDKIGSKVTTDFLTIHDKAEKLKEVKLKEVREKIFSERISWLERRIITSFPDMKSTRYSNIFKDIRNKVFDRNKKNNL